MVANVPLIKSEEFSKIENINHAFFGRKGGVSSGIYSSLNIGYGSGDDRENVRQNRHLAMQSFGQGYAEFDILDASSLNTLYQIHSDKVVTITDCFEGKIEADALVTNKPKIVLGILTADCTPVLFSDESGSVIGAAHAGWKGACGGILDNTVSQMQGLGAKNIHAVIGPTIRQKSYEVGAEFLERFISFDKNNDRFFIPSVKEGHFMFDLPAYVKARLLKIGVISVSDMGNDTCSEEEDFFSYRRCCLRAEGDYGRNLSAIAIKK